MAQVQGKIHHIGSVEQITDNYSKREFILNTDTETQYPQHVTLCLNNQKASLIDNFKVGDEVVVDINIQGKLAKNDNTKAFNNLVAYKIVKK